jgi:hypothetical protein
VSSPDGDEAVCAFVTSQNLHVPISVTQSATSI